MTIIALPWPQVIEAKVVAGDDCRFAALGAFGVD